ncbi:hypothetical protein FE633_38085 [Streptomyces montanus]|uniref:DUF1579 domain-containing protein n=1 Tax=Streptomyces montanus TaxID=2580423 RepID=A0A5R9FJT5_9ACTN|nr:hypothetical protein [Streptomyces montanus]TLS41103.1 hypothetical protein FE633_38085 [Streptomyces montanus]
MRAQLTREGRADLQLGGGEDRAQAQLGGKGVRVRFVWSGISDTTARWEQAFSVDGEKTWVTNWFMDFTRRAAPVSGTTSA